MATYPGISTVDAQSVASGASNLRTGTNPAFTTTDFLALYPQFTSTLSTTILQSYIDAATACISEQRFRAMWKMAMGYFVAHFSTIHVQTMGTTTADSSTVAALGQTQGITTSESVDGVSYSTDVSSLLSDLTGFAGFKLTAYGIQLVTLAKIYSKGGIVVQ